MKNLIEVSNHIMRYSQVYHLDAPVTPLIIEEVQELCGKYGEEFVSTYIENYLNLASGKVY